MHQFYFNDCFPSNTVSLADFGSYLEKTIREYNSLVKKNIGIERGIILEKESEKIIINGGCLKDAILSIPHQKRDLRDLAFAYFTKYPIQFHLISDEIDDKLLDEQYCFEGNDATNLAIARHNRCFLFSVPVDSCLGKNILEIKGKSEILSIDNLFGQRENTQYIESQIRKINFSVLNNFDRLKEILDNPVWSKPFERAFKAEAPKVQESIVERFEFAKQRGLPTSFYPDTKIIGDVTPDSNKTTTKVYELRVYKPVALRVYFFEFNRKVFVAGLGYKSNYKEVNSSSQSKDISNALRTIDNLIKTSQ